LQCFEASKIHFGPKITKRTLFSIEKITTAIKGIKIDIKMMKELKD